jgi:hypothetical protein
MMNSIQAFNIQEQLITLPDDEINLLKTQIRGPIVLPTDTNYNSCRKIWNAMIDRKPALIIQCQSTTDVVHAVQFAHKHHLLISVRGAGHNIAGRALKDNVLLIDLSQMRYVHVDPKKQLAYVCPGATLADLDHETQAYGLAVPLGINSTTGVSGLTLGGGFGWLSRKYGMTIDNLIEAEVVTVDGNRLVCNEQQHPDLFWGIRGGGGNFGIVTSFTFKLHPLHPEVICGPTLFDFKEAESVLQNYRQFCKTAPNDLSVWAVLRQAPPFPFIDARYHGQPVVILVGIYTGKDGQAMQYFNQIKQLGNALGSGVGPCPFVQFQQAFDPLLVPGARNYWKSHNFIDLKDGLFDEIITYINKIPNGHSEIFLGQMGGKTNDIDTNATAYPHRDVNFIMNVHTRWQHAAEDKVCVQWARDFFNASKPFASGGVYVNFVSEGDDSVDDAFSHNARQLAQLKAKYDPDNVLRSNLNIAP